MQGKSTLYCIVQALSRFGFNTSIEQSNNISRNLNNIVTFQIDLNASDLLDNDSHYLKLLKEEVENWSGLPKDILEFELKQIENYLYTVILKREVKEEPIIFYWSYYETSILKRIYMLDIYESHYLENYTRKFEKELFVSGGVSIIDPYVSDNSIHSVLPEDYYGFDYIDFYLSLPSKLIKRIKQFKIKEHTKIDNNFITLVNSIIIDTSLFKKHKKIFGFETKEELLSFFELENFDKNKWNAIIEDIVKVISNEEYFSIDNAISPNKLLFKKGETNE